MDENSAILKAREFLQQIDIGAGAVPVEPYLALVNAQVTYSDDLLPGQSGVVFKSKDRHHIVINSKESPERQRFTIFHEIGHIVLNLPSNHDGVTAGIAFGETSRPIEEACCDAFACECLMPNELLREAIGDQYPSFDLIKALSTRFEASLTSTGSSMARLNQEPCAFVLSEGGRIRFVSSSLTFREKRGYVATNTYLPSDSVAQRIRAKGISGRVESLTAGVETWLPSFSRQGYLLTEESIYLADWDQTLSLLILEEGEEYNEAVELDEDDALKELDGVLPWPSKSGRR